MTDDSRALPPAGFYPDPSGGPGRRWWDGQRWTDRVEQAYTGAAVQQPALAEGTRTDTVWIWILVLLPLVNALALALFDWRGYFQSSIDSSLSQDPSASLSQFTYPGYALLQLLSFLIYGTTVVLAWLDWRALKKLGIVQPFHWAWAFLFSLVYVIGRSVVVRRRARGGLAPLWVFIAVSVVGFIVIAVVVGSAFTDVLSSVNFSELPSSTG